MKLRHHNHFITLFSSLLHYKLYRFNPLSANPAKWSNELPTNCLSVFDYFVGLALKGLKFELQDHADYETMILITYNKSTDSTANYSRNQLLSKSRLGHHQIMGSQNFDRTKLTIKIPERYQNASIVNFE